MVVLRTYSITGIPIEVGNNFHVDGTDSVKIEITTLNISDRSFFFLKNLLFRDFGTRRIWLLLKTEKNISLACVPFTLPQTEITDSV
jgi:hypothetical protein